MQRIKLRYAQNDMAVLEQRDESDTTRLILTLYELRGIVDYLKSPTEAPFVFYSQHPEPLSVQFNSEDMSYQIERGGTVLQGVRGKPEEVHQEDKPEENSGKYGFRIFKRLMAKLSRSEG